MVIEHSKDDGLNIDLMKEHVEPMLQENLDRFVLFPIEHDDIWACLLYTSPSPRDR